MLIIREMQIKTTRRNHLTHIRIATTTKATNNKCWRGCRERALAEKWKIYCWWKSKLVQPLWKTVWRFLKNLKLELPHDSAISLLGLCLRKTKMLTWWDIRTPMFIAALFTTAKVRPQPKCPSTGGWIKTMWSLHTMEYYSSLKRVKECRGSDVDGPGECHTEWSKTEGERAWPPHTWNLKRNDTDELIYRTETHRQKMNLCLLKGKG